MACWLWVFEIGLVGALIGVVVGAVDVAAEQVVTFGELARRLPRKRLGRQVHVSTVHRWRHPGVRGVRLEAVRVGGCWCTSMEAYARFVEVLTRQAQGQQVAASAPSERQSEKAVERALDDLGL